MTLDAKILSFDEVKAHGASAPRTVSPSSSSRRAYDRYSAALGEQDFGTPAFLPNSRNVSTSNVPKTAGRSRNQFVGAASRGTQRSSRATAPNAHFSAGAASSGTQRSSRYASGASYGEGYGQSRMQGMLPHRSGRYEEAPRYEDAPKRARRFSAGNNFDMPAMPTHNGFDAPVGRTRNSFDAQASRSRTNRSGRSSFGYYSEAEERAERSSRYAASPDSEQRAHRGQQEKGLVAGLKKKFRSVKADRQFDRTVGARERAEAERMQQQQGGGSRAAVYDMRMGATQRRSSRMAEEGRKKAPALSLPFGIPFAMPEHVPQWATRVAATGAVFMLAAVMLFPCFQNLYNETRSLQQLQAEYSALESYNAKMQTQVDYLNTDEGLEDYARSELGWVRSDERVVNVEGVTSTSNGRSTERLYAITSGSVKAPDTWYSGVLDVIFGYGK